MKEKPKLEADNGIDTKILFETVTLRVITLIGIIVVSIIVGAWLF